MKIRGMELPVGLKYSTLFGKVLGNWSLGKLLLQGVDTRHLIFFFYSLWKLDLVMNKMRLR